MQPWSVLETSYCCANSSSIRLYTTFTVHQISDVIMQLTVGLCKRCCGRHLCALALASCMTLDVNLTNPHVKPCLVITAFCSPKADEEHPS
jgi:hypothetical protein